MTTELSFGGIIGQGIKLGFVNAISILLAYILWLLTIWIPYVNVGTTIAILSLPIGISKGNIVSPLEIFKSKYREQMGEFFVLIGLKFQGLLPALIFLVVPFIILSVTWSQATYLLLDKKVNPAEALSLSNKITDGHKWKLFFGKLTLMLLASLSALPAAIFDTPFLLVLCIGAPFFIVGANGFIYKSLSKEIN